MHSYLKRNDGHYDVGIWLAANNDSMFQGLFYVRNLVRAVDAVNMLNGGGGFNQEAFIRLDAKELED